MEYSHKRSQNAGCRDQESQLKLQKDEDMDNVTVMAKE